MKFSARLVAIAAVLALPASAALAAPTFDRFGPLPEATFGGTGIPNDHVAVSTRTFEILEGEPITLTLGLTAHRRFDNPPLSNDGAGTFTATTGTNTPSGSTVEGALWNFAFFVGVEGATIEQLVAEDYHFLLAFDFDPGETVDAGTILLNFATGSVVQGSQNLLFGFLANGVPGIVFPPAGSFDPNAPGLFSFSLTAIDMSGGFLTTSIDVRVVPVPATVFLFGFGLAGLAVVRRRRKA